jgi:hypothetical protein
VSEPLAFRTRVIRGQAGRSSGGRVGGQSSGDGELEELRVSSVRLGSLQSGSKRGEVGDPATVQLEKAMAISGVEFVERVKRGALLGL